MYAAFQKIISQYVERLKQTRIYTRLLPEGSRRKDWCWWLYRRLVPPPSNDCGEGAAFNLGQTVELYQNLYKWAGRPLCAGDRILDFGCGAGQLVLDLNKLGYAAQGYDIENYLAEESKQHSDCFSFYDGPRVPGSNIIDWGTFRLPYPDNFFDAVISHQVFEHLMAHEPVVREFSRVLKPGTCSINSFPSKKFLFETHLKIPFGHWIRSKRYYYMMALLGFRNEYQKGLGPREVSELNFHYTMNCLNYLSRKELLALGTKYFMHCSMEYGVLEKKMHTPPAALAWFFEFFAPNVHFIMCNKKI